jgi:hypothetical protein
MEPNQIDILAFTVLRDLEKIYDAQETGLSRQLWSDVQKTDRLNGIHFNLTFVHTVPGAHGDVGASPDSDAASDFSATNAIAKALAEDHDGILRSAHDCHFDSLISHKATRRASALPLRIARAVRRIAGPDQD